MDLKVFWKVDLKSHLSEKLYNFYNGIQSYPNSVISLCFDSNIRTASNKEKNLYSL